MDHVYAIQLNPDGQEQMAKIMRLAECDVGTCIRNALSVYQMLLARLADGEEILLRDQAGTLSRVDILKFIDPT